MSIRSALLCLVAVLVAGGLFVTGHGPHVVGYIPYLILLACPLMHIVMHRRAHYRSEKHEAKGALRSAGKDIA